MAGNRRGASNAGEKRGRKKRARAETAKEAEPIGDANRGVKDTRKQFGPADYALICDWLQVPENLDSITGVKGKTKVGVRYKTKKQAFDALAAFINDRQLKGSKLVTVDGDGARNRFTLLEKKFKATKPIVENTGWGLTAEDEANHIDSIEAKLESLCPCYCRLDAIFGGDPHVNFAENNYNTPLPGGDGDVMPWEDSWTDYAKEGCASGENAQEVCADGNVPTTDPAVVMPTNGGTSPIPSSGVEIPIAASERTNPVGEEGPVQGAAASQSATHEKGGSASSQKKNGNPNKKQPEKGPSIQSAFADGLESISKTKEQSNVLKERGQDLIFKALECDRALRQETHQQQLDFQIQSSQKQLDFQIVGADRLHEIEVEKLRVAEKRIAADEKKIAADARRDFIQAKVALVTTSAHRSAVEIVELFCLMADPEGMPKPI